MKSKCASLKQRYIRQGYLKALKEAVAKTETWRQQYKSLYAERTNQADAQMCLGKVFAAEDIAKSLESMRLGK
jgi:hypothetical protein